MLGRGVVHHMMVGHNPAIGVEDASAAMSLLRGDGDHGIEGLADAARPAKGRGERERVPVCLPFGLHIPSGFRFPIQCGLPIQDGDQPFGDAIAEQVPAQSFPDDEAAPRGGGGHPHGVGGHGIGVVDGPRRLDVVAEHAAGAVLHHVLNGTGELALIAVRKQGAGLRQVALVHEQLPGLSVEVAVDELDFVFVTAEVIVAALEVGVVVLVIGPFVTAGIDGEVDRVHIHQRLPSWRVGMGRRSGPSSRFP